MKPQAPACADCDGGDCSLCPWSGRSLKQIREEYDHRDPDHRYRTEARTPPPAPAQVLVLERQPFETVAPCSSCDCDLHPPMDDPCFCTCHLDPSAQPAAKPRQLDLFGGASS